MSAMVMYVFFAKCWNTPISTNLILYLLILTLPPFLFSRPAVNSSVKSGARHQSDIKFGEKLKFFQRQYFGNGCSLKYWLIRSSHCISIFPFSVVLVFHLLHTHKQKIQFLNSQGSESGTDSQLTTVYLQYFCRAWIVESLIHVSFWEPQTATEVC